MTLVEALSEVESGNSDWAIGDKHLEHPAYGRLQIRQPYVDDVNTRFGTTFKAQDCLGNANLSIVLYYLYMDIYATPERLGRPVTDEDKARIHNGGPNGWKMSATEDYWNRVKAVLNT